MRLNIPEMESNILNYWKEDNSFQKSLEKNSKDKAYVFYDGPPFATGLPHHGSLLASVIKDVIPRYKTMRGYYVNRVWGWDCHGLPIENLVENQLDLNSKKDIEALGVEKFNHACRASVLTYDREWKEYVDRVGRWVDFDNSYKTMDNSYIESVWWGFKQIFDKGLAYEGRHISLYCPRCSTPLSNFEIAMDNSYKNVTDHSTHVKFKVKDQENTFFLAWTTTPWTLPANVGLVVSKDADYVKVSHEEEFIWVGKDLAQSIFGDDVQILETVKGTDLDGKEYEPLYDYMPLEGKRAFYVGIADFVSLTDGTGIVHTAAMYGEDDYRYAKEKDLPRVDSLDETGRFLPHVKAFAGVYFKDAEQSVVDDLQSRGLLFKDEPYKHSYPFCWRCDTALYYNAVPAWFINVTKVKDKMVELNEQINWYPNHLKHGRFKYGLESAPDWNISRNRYWGSPIPVWQCSDSDCEKIEVIGSIQELANKSDQVNSPDEIKDLHLPYIDEHSWDCECKKGKMNRVTQVFDCWVESGSMPFASLHYPFENKELFEKNFPGEFIAEYIAQTRGWFYTLHVLSTAIFEKPSFVNAVTTGTIQAEDGRKMSKSKKNYTDPLELFDQYGADSFRFYLMNSPVMQAENLKFSDKGVKEIMRKVVLLLGNIHSLYAMFAHDSQYTVSADSLKSLPLTTLDKWLLAKWNELLQTVTEQMDGYDVVRATRPIIEFINDFSTWYLRRSRDRFKGQDQKDKDTALAVTRFVLEELVKTLAPFMPFMSEHLYQQLPNEQKESVHLQDWPKQYDWMNYQSVLQEMQGVRQVIEVALSLRAESGLKVRQAVQDIVLTLPPSLESLSQEYISLLKDEINCKEVHVVSELSVDEKYIQKEGKFVTVALNTELNESLLMEGLARDLVRQINNLRKQAGLSIDSRINVYYQTDSDFVTKTIEKFSDQLKQDTLSDLITSEPVTQEQKTSMKFHEHELELGIEKN